MGDKIFEFFRALMWLRFKEHNFFGYLIMGIMIILTYIRLIKFDERDPKTFRELCIRNLELFVVSLSFTSFFIHVIDMTSIPTLYYLFGGGRILTVLYFNDIVLQQLVVLEAFIVYRYRQWFDLSFFLKYIPIMVLYAFATGLIFGATSVRQLRGDAMVICYMYHYIPTWIMFLFSYMLLIEKPKKGNDVDS